jgi:hypothetical protein
MKSNEEQVKVFNDYMLKELARKELIKREAERRTDLHRKVQTMSDDELRRIVNV